MFNGGGGERKGRCRTKPPVLFFYHTYPMNMCAHLCQTQETGGGQGGSVVQLYNDQNRTCFLFPTCVFFPNYAQTSKSLRKEAEKKTHPSPHQPWRACRWGGAPPPKKKTRASCSLCLALFVCISSYSSGSPRMEGRKKDSSPDGL